MLYMPSMPGPIVIPTPMVLSTESLVSEVVIDTNAYMFKMTLPISQSQLFSDSRYDNILNSHMSSVCTINPNIFQNLTDVLLEYENNLPYSPLDSLAELKFPITSTIGKNIGNLVAFMLSGKPNWVILNNKKFYTDTDSSCGLAYTTKGATLNDKESIYSQIRRQLETALASYMTFGPLDFSDDGAEDTQSEQFFTAYRIAADALGRDINLDVPVEAFPTFKQYNFNGIELSLLLNLQIQVLARDYNKVQHTMGKNYIDATTSLLTPFISSSSIVPVEAKIAPETVAAEVIGWIKVPVHLIIKIVD